MLIFLILMSWLCSSSKTRKLNLKDIIIREIKIINIFHRLVGRLELVWKHKWVVHVSGQLVGAGPALFPLFFSQVFES